MEIKTRKNNKVPKEVILLAQDLYLAGWAPKDIAEETGMFPASITYYCGCLTRLNAKTVQQLVSNHRIKEMQKLREEAI